MSATAVARGVIALVAFGFLIAQPASANDAAHKMAEKFAGPSKGTSKEPASAKAEDRKQAEADKKAQADAQAAEAKKKKEAERKAAEAKKRAAEDARRKEAQKKAEAQRRAAMAEEAKHRAGEERKAEETEMLARAHREVEEMRGAEEQTRLAEEARRLIEEAGKERARTEALLAEQAEQTRSKDVEEAQLAQRRLEETKALAEKLKRVRQIREARLAAQGQKEKNKGPTEPGDKGSVAAAPMPQVATVERPEPAPERTEAAQATSAAPVATPKELSPPVVAAAPTPPSPPPATLPAPTARVEETAARLPPPAPPASTEPAKAPAPANETRVTVLLVLEPGTYGIRRKGPRTADPLLCTPPDGCYVSAGADRPAMFLHGRKALGFGNTMGNRAGACRNSLGCVFRDVELAEMPGYLQPVDLHILKHDRRRPQAILGDSNCRSDAGRLSCTRGIYAEDYVMWIVPESLADAVGPAVLEQAVSDGLNGSRSAELYSRR